MAMDLDAKKGHLLRRFAFGANPADRKILDGLTLDQSIDRLLKTDAPDLGHRFQYAWREKEEPDMGSYRHRTFWVAQMVTTPTPLREKLAVFWHSHFAASESKVEHGPFMGDYMDAVRTDPAGNFRDIVHRMVKQPAFMRMLDVRRMLKGLPNENFARELLELYTLGVGHYTESDIKSVSRAVTGWSYDDLWWESAEKESGRLKNCIQWGVPSCTFATLTSVHDDSAKTFLGKTQNWTGDQVLDTLAVHPQTARFVCGKLWAFFGSETPAPKAIEAMAKKFLSSKGSIRETLREMTKTPDFWSASTVGSLVKSPLDYCMGMCRGLGHGPLFREWAAKRTDINSWVEPILFDRSNGIAYSMEIMGQSLLNPPGVQGWGGGSEWISTNNMVRRKNFGGVLYWENHKQGDKDHWVPPIGLMQAADFVLEAKPAASEDIVSSFLDFMDCDLNSDSRKTLAEVISKRGGLELLTSRERLGGALDAAFKLLRMAPEYHLC